MTSRREFLHSSALALLAGCAGVPRAPAARPRLPLGFSTLGSPKWSWKQILDFARQHDFAALELRGLEDKIDITQHPALAPDRLPDVNKQLADRGLAVACLGASARMHDLDAAQLDEASRFGDAGRLPEDDDAARLLSSRIAERQGSAWNKAQVWERRFEIGEHGLLDRDPPLTLAREWSLPYATGSRE